MKSKLKLIFYTITLGGLAFFNFANAALVTCGGRPNSAIPKACGIQDLIDNIFVIVNFLLGIASFVAIAYIVYGGVRMLSALGNEEQIKAAKSTITNAIVGLVIVLLAFVIITSVTSYLTGRSLTDLRNNFFTF